MKAGDQVSVTFSSEAMRLMRRHARSSMDAEICGVLIGVIERDSTTVEHVIPGENAREAGAHVTFTQETWSHIYQVKDAEYPDKRIVGWYHTHPSFGIFLSDHDLFIHENFFSDPNQIAWVIDPHSDEEGCFAWKNGKVARIDRFATFENGGKPEADRSPILPHDGRSMETPDPEPERRSEMPRVVRYSMLALSHLALLLVGFFIGWLITPVVVIRETDAHHVDRQGQSQPAPQYQQRRSK